MRKFSGSSSSSSSSSSSMVPHASGRARAPLARARGGTSNANAVARSGAMAAMKADMSHMGPGSSKAQGTTHARPSAKLTQRYGKVAALGGGGRARTNFSRFYGQGAAPFRLDHGSHNNRLAWDLPIHELPYDPLLVTCFEGLCEIEHPYVTLSRSGLAELLAVDGAAPKVLPVLDRLVRALRAALMHKQEGVVKAAMLATRQLSAVVGPQLNPHLKLLIGQLQKKSFAKGFAEHITQTLQCLEEHGGPEALKEIKKKVPTYCTIRM